jgi:sulfate adenylyltransferase subunit 1
MPWYEGQTILQHLEALEPADVYEKEKYVFQYKPLFDQKEDHFRGCWKIVRNNIKVGDA